MAELGSVELEAAAEKLAFDIWHYQRPNEAALENARREIMVVFDCLAEPLPDPPETFDQRLCCVVCLYIEAGQAKDAVTIVGGFAVCDDHLGYPSGSTEVSRWLNMHREA